LNELDIAHLIRFSN